MRGSPVEVSGKLSLVVTVVILIPLVFFGYLNFPNWAVFAWEAIAATVIAANVWRGGKLGFEVSRPNSREDWELTIEGLAGYFVVGGVLLAVYSVLVPPITRTVCVQPNGTTVGNCQLLQTTSYIGQGPNSLLGNLGVIAYYEIIVGLFFLLFFLPFTIWTTFRSRELSVESDYYP